MALLFTNVVKQSKTLLHIGVTMDRKTKTNEDKKKRQEGTVVATERSRVSKEQKGGLPELLFYHFANVCRSHFYTKHKYL